jgi:hypothetical protein
MTFQNPCSPDQVENTERWAKPGSLEDSCPSYAGACPTKMEVQKGGLCQARGHGAVYIKESILG